MTRTRCHYCHGTVFLDADHCTDCGKASESNALKIDVKQCQRCGGNHSVTFRPLSNPADDHFTHWSICPSTHEPLLLAIVPAIGEATPMALFFYPSFALPTGPQSSSRGREINPRGSN